MNLDQTLEALRSKANPYVAQRKAKDFRIPIHNALGLYMKDLNHIAKDIGKDSDLALQLIATNIYEAKLLASKIFHKKDLSINLLNNWVSFFDTWEICDSYCMQLFKYYPASWDLMQKWVDDDAAYIKRAGFVVMATYGQGFKETPNEQYDICYPIILKHMTDNRNFVKKAINWAIREIGKRNPDLQEKCIALCREILIIDNATARWIASDALRELTNPNVKLRNCPKSIYRSD